MTPSASAPRREALVPRACALLVGLLVFGCCRAAAEYGTRRPPPGERKFESRAVEDVIDEYAGRMRDRDLAELFANCLPNTLDTTVHIGKDDDTGEPTTFVVTGDIEAMWLRDSSNQVLPYVRLASRKSDKALERMICGVINRQASDLTHDPFANAFNLGTEGGPHQEDLRRPNMTTHVFEGKFELDSLAGFLKLSNSYARELSSHPCFGEKWLQAVETLLQTMEMMSSGTRQEIRREPYRFSRRTEVSTDTLYRGGTGPPACQTGMIRSYFRPSDDACTLPFHVPANAMAAKELQGLVETVSGMAAEVGGHLQGRLEAVKGRALALAEGIVKGLKEHATVVHPKLGRVYAYEVDGCGSAIVMDDSNVPSLLSMPRTGVQTAGEDVYLRTRELVLSEDNPYYWRGSAGRGIGSPHVGPGYIWPMSIIMQAMTADDDEEIARCLEQLKEASAGSGFMHESFWKDDAADFTRPWFAWANGLFGELILELAERRPWLIFHEQPLAAM